MIAVIDDPTIGYHATERDASITSNLLPDPPDLHHPSKQLEKGHRCGNTALIVDDTPRKLGLDYKCSLCISSVGLLVMISMNPIPSISKNHDTTASRMPSSMVIAKESQKQRH